jgi:hypothetical protein
MRPRLLWIATFLFFAGYAAKKYFIVWPPAFDFTPGYLTSTAVVILVTGWLPFAAVLAATRGSYSHAKLAIASLAPIPLSALGYAAYWWFSIRHSYPNIDLADVAPRAVIPGAVFASILIVERVWATATLDD